MYARYIATCEVVSEDDDSLTRWSGFGNTKEQAEDELRKALKNTNAARTTPIVIFDTKRKPWQL